MSKIKVTLMSRSYGYTIVTYKPKESGDILDFNNLDLVKFVTEGGSDITDFSEKKITRINLTGLGDRMGFKKIVLPSTITLIREKCFRDCKNIEEIVLPSTLTTIESNAFEYCSGLKKVVFKSYSGETSSTLMNKWASIDFANVNSNPTRYAGDLHIGDTLLEELAVSTTGVKNYAFNNCKSLTKITVGLNNSDIRVATIGKLSFEYCDNLETVIINKSVIKADPKAFYRCKNIKYVTTPTSTLGSIPLDSLLIVELNFGDGIAQSTFRNAVNLELLIICGSVKEIGSLNFDYCTLLKKVHYKGSIADWVHISFPCYKDTPTRWSKDLYIGNTTDGSLVTSVDLPDEYIAPYTLANCKSLKSVSCEYAKSNALYNCTHLETLTIKSLGVDGNESGSNCIHSMFGSGNQVPITLKTVDLSGCTDSTIQKKAFYGCSYIEEVILPPTLTSIKESAFEGCTRLKRISIPASVAEIGKNAFKDCYDLHITCGVTSPLTKWDIYWNPVPCGVQWSNANIDLDNIRYSYNNYGKTATIVKVIHPLDLKNSYTIPSKLVFNNEIYTITIIGANAFQLCENLTEVYIPDTVVTIGKEAFYGCNSLVSVNIPNSVSSAGVDVFSDCTKLTSAVLPSQFVYILPNTIKKIILNNSNDTIGQGTFVGLSQLTDVTIPKNLNRFWIDAFRGCSSLKNVYYQGSIDDWVCISFLSDANSNQAIYSNPLYYATNFYVDGKNDSPLTDIVLSNAVTEIKSFAFYNFKGIKTIVIPDTVTTMGAGVFTYCTNLTHIYCEATSKPNTWNNWNPSNRPVYWYSETNKSGCWHYTNTEAQSGFKISAKTGEDIFSSKNFTIDKNGNVNVKGHIEAESGKIGNCFIDQDGSIVSSKVENDLKSSVCIDGTLGKITLNESMDNGGNRTLQLSGGKLYMDDNGNTITLDGGHIQSTGVVNNTYEGTIEGQTGKYFVSSQFDSKDGIVTTFDNLTTDYLHYNALTGLVKGTPIDGIKDKAAKVLFTVSASNASLIGRLNGSWWVKQLTESSSSAVTSDKNKKNSIEYQTDVYSKIFDNLKPAIFKYNDGESDRTHTGFIAQDVELAVLDAGLTTRDFAAVCYDTDVDGNKTDYSVRYSEIVSMNTYEILKLKSRVKELEDSINELKSKIDTNTNSNNN